MMARSRRGLPEVRRGRIRILAALQTDSSERENKKERALMKLEQSRGESDESCSGYCTAKFKARSREPH
jgi:hypothetical protein